MTTQVVVQIFRWGVALAAIAIVVRQCRKPLGWPGRAVAWGMNRSHSGLTDWGLTHVRVEPDFTILDVGCGGGRTIQKLAAAASRGHVYGVDYSAASVAEARRTNAGAPRVEIQQATVSRLPFSDATFDLVTAVETHYYWPDLTNDLREILRVLKPGGRLVIIAEAYKGRQFDVVLPVMLLLGARYLTVDEHRGMLDAAGYAEIAIDVDAKKGWICARGSKPFAG